MIESLFGYNLQNSIKNDETKSKTPSPGKHVLEPKRLQNITILSKALNATAEHVCDALMQGKLYLNYENMHKYNNNTKTNYSISYSSANVN